MCMGIKVTYPAEDILEDEMIKDKKVWLHRSRDDESNPPNGWLNDKLSVHQHNVKLY